ncbi:MAG: glycoside hydrolase family 28 protein [Clostridium butyricum]|nr:glycoside hydrolase family 28 protein [Clostridium butyricum]
MRLKKTLSVVMCTAITMGSLSIGASAHVNTNSAPKNVQVPSLAYDDECIVLTWEKGDNYSNIVDYNIYQDGKFIGSANENFKKNSKFTAAYMKSFYDKDIEKFHVKTQIQTFKVNGLEADTEYKFTVKGVLADGSETEASDVCIQKTTEKPKEFNIKDYGAIDTGRIVDYSGKEELIKANTKAIQSAIDACTEGGKVVIPEGVYTTGSLWLKSNMTLELKEGAVLSGSTNTDDYPRTYYTEDDSVNVRSWGILNAYNSNCKLENIRIVGDGTIDGNGWMYSDGNKNSSDPIYQTKDVLDPEGDEYKLPQFAKGTKTTVYKVDDEESSLGLLAKDAVKKALNDGIKIGPAYTTRPNLAIIKNVDNVYVEGITTQNPAYHNITFVNCNNATVDSVTNLTYDANNADGVEFDCSQNCKVFGSFFDTGDDSVNFAAGMGEEAKSKNPTQNVRVFNNFIRHGHGGAIAAGSHTGAWIQNIVAEDNVINGNEIPFRFKSVPVNGGGVRNVVIRDNAVENPLKQGFVFTTEYKDNNQVLSFKASSTRAQFANIDVKNVTVKSGSKSATPIQVIGDIKDGHQNINFQNVKFKDFTKGCSINGLNNGSFNNVEFSGNKVPVESEQFVLKNSTNINIAHN